MGGTQNIAQALDLQRPPYCLLGSILLDPFLCGSIMLCPVPQVKLCYLWNQRITWVAIRQQRRNRKKHFRNCQSWAPLILEDVQTNGSVGIHVAMVDFCRKVHLWRLERIVGREIDVQKEAPSLVRTIRRTHDCRLPIEHIVSTRSSRTIRWWVRTQILQLFLNSLERHLETSAELT